MNNTINYRQCYEDDWIYLAIKMGNMNRIYIYRDREDHFGEEGWNEWELAADKNLDFDKWYWFEEKWDRDTNCEKIDDKWLKERGIPPLKINENGEVMK